MRHIYLRLPALAALCALPLSCLRDDDDKFGLSASERMSSLLDETMQTLTGSEHGWEMDYYSNPSQSYGGYAYTMRFTPTDVHMLYELDTRGAEQTTGYRLKSDMGPVLSFDQLLTLFHYHATPSWGNYRALEGDFEFVIDSVGTDLIKMHGKRTHNTIYLRRLERTASSYMSAAAAVGASLDLAAADLSIGGTAARVEFAVDASGARSRHLLIASATDSVYTAYAVTDTGVRLYRPVTINGRQVWDLTYDRASLSLSAPGLTTVRAYVSPSVVKVAVSDMGFSNEGGAGAFGVDHLDQFDFAADADWVTISTGDGNVTVTAAPNATGHPRSATVSARYRETSTDLARFSVRQCDLGDILGDYAITFTNLQETQETLPATISQEADGGQVVFSIEAAGGQRLSSNVTFDETRRAIVVSGGRNGFANDTSYYWNLMLFADGTVGTTANSRLNALFSYDEAAATTTAVFEGRLLSYELAGWVYSVSPSATQASLRYSNMLLWMERPTLRKTATAGGPAAQAPTLAPATPRAALRRAAWDN